MATRNTTKPLRIPIDWGSDDQIRRLFSWQTRVGLAPKFGTCSIHHYQNSQMDVYKALEKVGKGTLQVRNGVVFVGEKRAGTVRSIGR